MPEPLATDLWRLTTAAGNCYLWRDGDGLVVVDPGQPGAEVDVLDAVMALGHTHRDVRTIVLTQRHPTRGGAAPALAAATRAGLALGVGHPWLPPVSSGPAWPFGRGRALDDGDELGDVTRAVVHAAGGGAAGNVALHLPALDVVVAGDLIRQARDGRILAGHDHADVDLDLARVARRLAALRPDTVYPGDGSAEDRYATATRTA